MKTYNDLMKLTNEADRRLFLGLVIQEHRSSAAYKTAVIAEQYYRHLNPTIMAAQKFIHDALGRTVPDIYSANNKIPSRYYFYFVTQAVQFLLGNGVTFGDAKTKERLGKGFDHAIQNAVTRAINGGISFAFWNNDHVEVFPFAGTAEPCFAPLYDEENGALRAGVRYWQIDATKPMRATMYEEDGYTEYVKYSGKDFEELYPKRKYIQIVQRSDATGEQIFGGENYPMFPIVPMFNVNKQSEIIGNRETLDAYDLMASALVNNVDDGNLIYWVIKNCGAMDDDITLQRFVQHMKVVRAVGIDGDSGVDVDAHTVEAPFEANEVALKRLRDQLFEDFMALDVRNIAGGAATATQIQAAYEPLNSKTDLLEYQVTDFINRLLAVVGIDDVPTYTRSLIINQQETIQTIIQAGTDLPQEYKTKKIAEVLGDADRAEEIYAMLLNEDANRIPFEGDMNA